MPAEPVPVFAARVRANRARLDAAHHPGCPIRALHARLMLSGIGNAQWWEETKARMRARGIVPPEGLV